GRALDIVMAAEDVRAAARDAHVAQRHLNECRGSRLVVADMGLRQTHAPDEGARTVLRHDPRDAPDLVARDASHTLRLGRRPALDLLAHRVHSEDPLADELLVLPAVLEDMPEHALHERDIGTGA